jgi:hypothetical protein
MSEHDRMREQYEALKLKKETAIRVKERAAVVAFLRAYATSDVLDQAANAIERGEHLTEES